VAVAVVTSEDMGAPALTGQVGSLLAVLDFALLPLGWTKPFSGVNKAAYRMGAGLQHYLRVDDSGAGTGGAREARLRAFESMADVDTGTFPYPTVAQAASGAFWRKSATLDATPRPWLIVADPRTVYVCVQTGDVTGHYMSEMFGEFFSFKANDLGRSGLTGRTAENSALSSNNALAQTTAVGVTGTATSTHYLARDLAGGTGVTFGCHGYWVAQATGDLEGQLAFPNAADGKILLSPVWVHDTTSRAVHGRMRGFRHFAHVFASVADRDTFSDATHTYLIVKPTGINTNRGIFCFIISDTWESNP